MCKKYVIRYEGCQERWLQRGTGELKRPQGCTRQLYQAREFLNIDGLQFCRGQEGLKFQRCPQPQEIVLFFTEQFCSDECEGLGLVEMMQSNKDRLNYWIDYHGHRYVGNLRTDRERVLLIHRELATFSDDINRGRSGKLGFPIEESWPATVTAMFLASDQGKEVNRLLDLRPVHQHKILQYLMGDFVDDGTSTQFLARAVTLVLVTSAQIGLQASVLVHVYWNQVKDRRLSALGKNCGKVSWISYL